jgi:hypothetical protein
MNEDIRSEPSVSKEVQQPSYLDLKPYPGEKLYASHLKTLVAQDIEWTLTYC